MSVDTNFHIGAYLVVDQFIEDTETKRVIFTAKCLMY